MADEMEVDREAAQKPDKMFTLKKWNLVAMWSWDVECDTCAICRVQVMGRRNIHNRNGFKVLTNCSFFYLFRRYLTRELIWHSQSSIRPSKMIFLLFDKKINLWRVLYHRLNLWHPALEVSTLPLGYRSVLERWSSDDDLSASIRMSFLFWHYLSSELI